MSATNILISIASDGSWWVSWKYPYLRVRPRVSNKYTTRALHGDLPRTRHDASLVTKKDIR